MKFSCVILLILNFLVRESKQRSLVFSACQHLPYDFYNIPGTNDYFYLRYEYVDFYGARDFCKLQGMDLPPILNEEQNSLIHCKIQGFHFFYFRKTLICSAFDKKAFIKHSKYSSYYTAGVTFGPGSNTWLTGDAFSYARFDSNQKNTTVLDIHVVISSLTGNWLKVPCNFKTGVICHVRC